MSQMIPPGLGDEPDVGQIGGHGKGKDDLYQSGVAQGPLTDEVHGPEPAGRVPVHKRLQHHVPAGPGRLGHVPTSSVDSASGFSHSTCLPASRTVHSA